ncbi:DUF4265 domain-containing protein [Propionibacteriaceae bacterium G1746]
MSHIWISLPQDEDGYPPFAEEQLHTTPVGENLHRLEATPAFAVGIAVDDVLRTQTLADGTEWATEVVEQGDHWCSRIVGLNGYEHERIVEIMASMGGTAADTPYGLVTVDFDASVDVKHVLAELEAGRREGDWDFDLGVDPRA